MLELIKCWHHDLAKYFGLFYEISQVEIQLEWFNQLNDLLNILNEHWFSGKFKFYEISEHWTVFVKISSSKNY